MWYSINRKWNFDRGLKFALLDRVLSYLIILSVVLLDRADFYCFSD